MKLYILLCFCFLITRCQETTDLPKSDTNTTTTPETNKNSTTPDSNQNGTTIATTTVKSDPDENNSTETSTTEDPSDDDKVFIDVSTFVESMNLWNFRGMWGKFNLSHHDDSFNVPENEGSEDHIVIVNEVSTFMSLLRKRFPPLINATLSMTYSIKFSDIFIVGLTVNAVKKEQLTFLEATEKRWKTRNNYWITETFDIGTHNTSFEVIFKAKTSTTALWSIDIITVEGIGEGNHSNHSKVPPAVVPPHWHQKNDTDEDSSEDDDEKDSNSSDVMTTIASSMWQAIYVFIALFILAFVLFIILMIKQKKSKTIIEPVVGTYDHRPSMPNVKPHDNRAYQTDSV